MEKQGPDIIPITGEGGTGRSAQGIIGAISQIQQFYVIESLGQDIPDEFLTLEGQLNYFNCGFGGGFIEGLTFAVITALLLPIMADTGTAHAVASFFPLVRYKLFLYTVNCLPIILFCFICCYLSKYRVGKLTKKAVDNLLIGRMFSMAIKGVLIFAAFIMTSNAITATNAYKTAKIMTVLDRSYLPVVYRVILNLKPTLITTAYDVAFIFAMATLVPFITIWLVSIYRSVNRTRVERFWNIG
ncbi:MAG: hypothetical protein KKD44_17235 [Proteobacteria bacterium]|nr:hypothetical protein [Pseudomonadota bacterium]